MQLAGVSLAGSGGQPLLTDLHLLLYGIISLTLLRLLWEFFAP